MLWCKVNHFWTFFSYFIFSYFSGTAVKMVYGQICFVCIFKGCQNIYSRIIQLHDFTILWEKKTDQQTQQAILRIKLNYSAMSTLPECRRWEEATKDTQRYTHVWYYVSEKGCTVVIAELIGSNSSCLIWSSEAWI